MGERKKVAGQTQRQPSWQHSQESNYIYGQEGKMCTEAGSRSQTSVLRQIRLISVRQDREEEEKEAGIAGEHGFKQQTATGDAFVNTSKAGTQRKKSRKQTNGWRQFPR